MAIDTKAKVAQQSMPMMKEIDSWFMKDHRPIQSEDIKKDVKAKKPSFLSFAYTSRKTIQSGQTIARPKKNFCTI